MKNKLALAIALASLTPLSATADVSIYGKLNVSLESVSEGDASYTQLQDNASRLGFKGSEKISDTLEAVYKMEYQLSADDGDTFKQRNIYVGLKGDFGTALYGNIDTPLKSAQKKVDIFGDQHGDIKHMITKNDNRAANVVAYISPSMSGVTASLAYAPSEADGVDDASSLSLAYNNDSLYLAVAVDSGVEGADTDATRVVAQYKIGAVQLGALYESFGPADGDNQDATFVSVKYNASKEWALKAQFGQSDQKEAGGSTVSIGADYKMSKKSKVFGFYTTESADDDAVDNNYVGLGIEVKF